MTALWTRDHSNTHKPCHNPRKGAVNAKLTGLFMIFTLSCNTYKNACGTALRAASNDVKEDKMAESGRIGP
jgi:hypothetical protein